MFNKFKNYGKLKFNNIGQPNNKNKGKFKKKDYYKCGKFKFCKLKKKNY